MTRMRKISVMLIALFLSAGAMAQSAPEANGGANAKSNPVAPRDPVGGMKMDTADSKMDKTTTNNATIDTDAKKAKRKAARQVRAAQRASAANAANAANQTQGRPASP